MGWGCSLDGVGLQLEWHEGRAGRGGAARRGAWLGLGLGAAAAHEHARVDEELLQPRPVLRLVEGVPLGLQ